MELFRLWGSIALNDQETRRGLREVNDEASNTSRGFGLLGKAGSSMGGMVIKYAGMAASALATLGGITAGINFNSMMENSQVAWTTLLGSAGKAKDMLQDISNFAKSTQFDTTSVDAMAKYMHNAGLEGQGLFDELTKVADVAGAFNIPADSAQELVRQMSQVRQAGVAYTEDLNILQDRGVPIFQALADVTGTNVAQVKKMASEGKITSDVYSQAFDKIANSVKGSADKQSQTFTGMLSTLQDNLSMIAGVLSKPLFDTMKNGLETLMPYLDKFLSGLKSGGLMGGFAAIFPPGVQTTINEVKNGIKGIFDLFTGKTAEGNGMLMAMGFSFDAVRQIDSIINTIKTTISQFFGYYVSYAQAEFEVIKGVFVAAWNFIKGLFSGDNSVAQSFISIFNTIKSIALPILQDVVAFIQQEIAKIKQFWDENGSQIIQAVQNAWSIIAAIFKAIAPVILFVVGMLWDSVKGAIDGALNIIMGLIKIFAGLFTGDWSKMWEGIKQLLYGAVEFIWNWINLMMFGRILGGIKAFFTESLGWFKNLWTETVNIFKGMGDGAWSMATNMFSKVKSVFQSILDSGRSIFSSLKDAIVNPIETAKGLIGNAIDGIKSFFHNIATHIPMPHFSISGSLNPMKWADDPPHLGVNWYAKGTNFAPGGLAVVGEYGPELIQLPRGSKVNTANETNQMLNNGGVQHLTIEAPIVLDGYEIGKAIFPAIDLMQSNQFNQRMALSGVKG